MRHAPSAASVWAIDSIGYRRILNSHVEFTTEFIVRLEDGSVGLGSSPLGETVSIYEDQRTSIDPKGIIRRIRRDGYLSRPLTQEGLDDYLSKRIRAFGRNNCYALSLAFFYATENSSLSSQTARPAEAQAAPHLCCNMLNGGWHAYTNPVLSDFSEYLLVSRTNDLETAIANHNDVQRQVRSALLKQPKIAVAGNLVNRFAARDNRECIEFLLRVCEHLGLSGDFDLMIDASAGDLWSDGRYRLSITDDSVWSSDEFCGYWLDLLKQYPIRFLEDPFREEDPASWIRLANSQATCRVIGDNYYSSDAAKIAEGVAKRCTHGVIVKPNQAGTVTAARRALETAQQLGQLAITSHRSISTELPFEATITCSHGVEYIKIGPLVTDYSSVVRLNEIIRIIERQPWHVRRSSAQ